MQEPQKLVADYRERCWSQYKQGTGHLHWSLVPGLQVTHALTGGTKRLHSC